MNALLWFLQFVLVLLYAAGGMYKVFNAGVIADQMHAIPRIGWAAIGAYEVVGAILLVVPAIAKWLQGTIPIVAAALAIETLAVAAVYAHASTQLVATNPLPWNLAIGVLAALLAWGRYRPGRRT